MIRKALFSLGAALLAVCASCSPEPTHGPEPEADDSARADPDAPHVVIVLADDLGWGDVGFHGGSAHTPHLDALAAAGHELPRLYSYSLCTPTRAALLTGVDPGRLGLLYAPLRPWDTGGLPAEVPTLAERLTDAGYETALVGKWHLGHTDPAQHPNARGFQHFYGFLNGRVDYWTHAAREGGRDWQRDGESLDEPGYATHLLAREAVRRIEQRDAQRPLFLFVSLSAPHTPKQAPADLLERAREALGQEASAEAVAHAAQVEALDSAVGDVLAALEAAEIADDTWFLFASDNGAGKDEGGSNGELRGWKGSAFEGSIRVPALLRPPASGAGAAAAPGAALSMLDVAPTVLALAGVPLEPDAGDPGRLDGRRIDVPPGAAASPRRLFFAAHSLNYTNYAVIEGRWKSIRRHVRADSKDFVRFLLYDLEGDPQERTTLVVEQAAKQAELSAALDDWITSVAGSPGPAAASRAPRGWRAPEDWASL